MHTFEETVATPPTVDDGQPWWKLLNRYHWFVLTVCSLGWTFDTMDQQLFNIARKPAMLALAPEHPVDWDGNRVDRDGYVKEWSGFSTSIFLIGWGTGGLIFGVLGDLIGRARSMVFTILLYSLFTGLSALSVGTWDFSFYRFLTGLGVGGQFAVGVSLVAEAMPERARSQALGWLQALSAIGNVTAALFGIGLAFLVRDKIVDGEQSWRNMFLIGTLPALLVLVIMRRLKDPERWQSVAAKKTIRERLGAYKSELFADRRWSRNALIGLGLASSGIIGLWAIGFFSIDLQRTIVDAQLTADRPGKITSVDVDKNVVVVAGPPRSKGELPLLDSCPVSETTKITIDGKEKQELTGQEGFAKLVKEKKIAKDDRIRVARDDDGATTSMMVTPGSEVHFREEFWAGVTSIMLNLGAFLGIYSFSRVTLFWGRKPTFAVAFVLALASTALVFWKLERLDQIFWMIPMMGFCQLALFGGYAIYFPELFPTRLRSTGVSFCYNGARYVAAAAPSLLGLMAAYFTRINAGDRVLGYRMAGVIMCSIFLVGLLILPFAPETKGKPLPE